MKPEKYHYEIKEIISIIITTLMKSDALCKIMEKFPQDITQERQQLIDELKHLNAQLTQCRDTCNIIGTVLNILLSQRHVVPQVKRWLFDAAGNAYEATIEQVAQARGVSVEELVALEEKEEREAEETS